MSVYSKEYLTGSGDGTPTAIAATATAGTTVHTVPASVVDEVWLWLSNHSTSDVVATVELGSTTATENIEVTVPASSVVLAIPGIPQAATNVVAVFAGTTNVVSAFGYANRITG